MKKLLPFFTLFVYIISCNQDKAQDNDAPEVSVHEGSKSTDATNDLDTAKAEYKPEEPSFDSEAGVADNVVLCENSKYTIRVDRMNNNNLRYACWNKPKLMSETPSLELDNGKLRDEGSWGRAYSFSNNGWEYQITDYTPAGDPTINVILKQGGTLKENIILKSQK